MRWTGLNKRGAKGLRGNDSNSKWNARRGGSRLRNWEAKIHVRQSIRQSIERTNSRKFYGNGKKGDVSCITGLYLVPQIIVIMQYGISGFLLHHELWAPLKGRDGPYSVRGEYYGPFLRNSSRAAAVACRYSISELGYFTLSPLGIKGNQN